MYDISSLRVNSASY